MRALQETVEQVLDTRRTGSRTLARDDHTLLLFDNEFLPQHAMLLVLERHPFTDISVQPCDASSSGYIVQFTLQPSSNPLTSAAFMYITLCVVLILYIHGSGLLHALLAAGT